MKEDKAGRISFFQWLRGRGSDGVKLVVGDKRLGMLEAAGEVFPAAKHQRCTVHFYRNVVSVTPHSNRLQTFLRNFLDSTADNALLLQKYRGVFVNVCLDEKLPVYKLMYTGSGFICFA